MSADDDKISLRRWDNGGVVELPWERLMPADAARVLALQKGEAIEEEMVDAVKLVLKDGSEVVGRIVEDRADRVRVQVGPTDTRTLVAASVVRREPTRVNALQFGSAQSLYDARARAADLKSAKAQQELGLFCLRLRLFDKAKEHLLRAAELDPALKAECDAKIALSERERVEEGARTLLDQIEKALAALKFDEARAAAAKLKETCAAARAARAAGDQDKRIAEAEALYQDRGKQVDDNRLFGDWVDAAQSALRKAAGRRELEIAKAREYVDRVLAEEVKATLAKRMGLEPQDVEARWSGRQPGEKKTAYYGDSSWIVDAGGGARKPGGSDAK
ncbi:MAG: hypothetical protein HZA54_02965, partial [Planctomycetes bacterium]|nr:hypothetical protein [Planctomycetota bacterium]